MSKKVILFTLLFFTSIIIFLSINQKNTGFISKEPSSVMEDLVSKKEGIYVFGFDECPWCKELYPYLETTLKTSKQTALLVDTHKNNFTDEHRAALLSFIQNQTNFDDIVVPIIFTISKDGYFQHHVGTVDSHDASSEKLSLQQEKELNKKLEQIIINYKEHN